MSYILATTEAMVRWYVFPIDTPEDIHRLNEGDFELVEILNLDTISGFGNKQTAKTVAMAVGLKTWRYVKISTSKNTFTIN